MNSFFTKFIDNVKKLNNKLEVRQKVIISALFLITLAIMIALISWSLKVDYGLLYGDLSKSQAHEIITGLNERNVKYKIKDDGTSIYVPKDAIHSTRINLSAEKIGVDNNLGFEIFDKSSIGMTEFVQNVNYKRAMEGELKKTIESIDAINSARVHLVFPKEKIFKEDEKPATASIVLNLRQRLNIKQLDGISNLVSSSVEGLESNNVTIINQNGEILTENYQSDLAGTSNYQLDLQKKIENQLTLKVQTMLDQIVGPGKSVVRIGAELNFNEVSTTSEQYNPDSKVKRSEEIETNESTIGVDSSSTASEHLISNYEIDKVIKTEKNHIGAVKRLTVAVNLDYRLTETQDADGNTVEEYAPIPAQEISDIENLVKNSVSYDLDRGDEIAVNSIKFNNREYIKQKEKVESENKRKEMIDLAINGSVILILFILIFALLSQFKKMFVLIREEEEEELPLSPALAGGTAEQGFYEEGEEGSPMSEGKITYKNKAMEDIEIEQTEDQKLREVVKKFILENPDVTKKLLKSWLIDKGSKE